MDFAQILDLLIQFGSLLLDLSKKVVEFFSMPMLDLYKNFLPAFAVARLEELGLADVSLIVFMIGSGFSLFIVYTLVKWVFDIIF